MATPRWHFPHYYSDVLGEKDGELGRSMMQEAATRGHAEALYVLSQRDGGDEELYVEALHAGSNRAIGKAWVDLTNELCDETVYRYIEIVREHAGDADYPWTDGSPWIRSANTETVAELRRAWWADMTSNIARIDDLRADACATAN